MKLSALFPGLLLAIGGLACGDGDEARDPPPPLPSFEELAPRSELPDPLRMLDGSRVESARQWRARRRPEILRMLDHYAYGFAPPAPVEGVRARLLRSDEGFLGGAATLEEIELRYGPPGVPPIELLLVIPADAPHPAPLVLALNFFGNHAVSDDPDIALADGWIPERGDGVVEHRATEASRGTRAARWPIALAVERGYAVATFYHGDVDPDRDDFDDGLHPHYREPGAPRRGAHDWGTLSAWAFGLSRALDHLVSDARVDAERVSVLGHSRNGKAALLAAARDERFAAAVSVQSGCGGAALSRRRVGETLFTIQLVYPHWFAVALRPFARNEERLPFDQHMLIAAVAPRPVLVTSARGDWWADPEGEFLGLAGAAPVYALLGAGGLDTEAMPPPGRLVASRLGYYIRPGEHSIGAEEWSVALDFLDAQLPR